jgi:hypothetical protein
MKNVHRLAIYLLLFVSSLNAQVPKVTRDLKPGTIKGRGILSLQPQQELALILTSTIVENRGEWMITDILETPFGTQTDTVTVEKGTLILRKRIAQGEGMINFEIAGNKITGTVQTAERQVAISQSLDTPLFADGPASAYSIALLPLAEGYTATYRNFDAASQRVIEMQLRVVGSESITVPAGTFDTFKVEHGPADGSRTDTLWVAKQTRLPVKSQSRLPNNIKVTLELVP